MVVVASFNEKRKEYISFLLSRICIYEGRRCL